MIDAHVREVHDVTNDPRGVERELALVKVKGTGEARIEAARVSVRNLESGDVVIGNDVWIGANVTILRKTRENTGLVRDDYFDWVKAAGELLSGAQKIDVAVMLLGRNAHFTFSITAVNRRSAYWGKLQKLRA